jgi:hypothetical protein
MGTRNLTCVYHENKYKVAQYGQWDGYPSGQGVTILSFLKKVNIKKFIEKLKKVRFIDKYDSKDKTFLEEYNKNCPQWSNQPDNRTSEQKEWFSTYASRDIGGKILSNILESKDEEIFLDNEILFAEDSLFCEYAYIIDLDKNVLEVYRGFNKNPLSKEERFYNDNVKNGEYFSIKLWKTFDLNKLPSKEEFLKELEEVEDNEDN